MKLAFIGFGGVGQSLAKLLEERPLGAEVVAISDMKKGAIYQPNGLDVKKVLEVVEEDGTLDNYPNEPGLVRGMGSIQTIEQTNSDAIVEVTYTDVRTGQPAIDHCRTAFQHQKSVVTTNKGPVALAYRDLAALAKERGVYWGFEGTVMSGTPALRLPEVTLAGNEIKEIHGILNGTTNYILTEMENGKPYQDALRQAQTLGYAEADPTSDVEGYDARYKVAILANYVMGSSLAVEDIPCEGISGLFNEDIKKARDEGKAWRLIASIYKSGEEVKAVVEPQCLDENDPLANVKGPTNAIVYECDLSGPIMLTGAGAGLIETGYALWIDLFYVKKQLGVTSI
ncbi:homoserine dehydrogenase [Texcoconibacillus texcoconensis]|uniref:Homoserine dehydrogenase n=1 Tax=Texcoconibacillus texcoconensis TaxID=1095777 RepID=A0A840QRS9_9BACI|nr:homoserine dehydrogenase [Texcoconibacillus texcoconensis]MBB5174182.1 homoserine dehydrogenase [Texcoconibacillus texcoconensis]